MILVGRNSLNAVGNGKKSTRFNPPPPSFLSFWN